MQITVTIHNPSSAVLKALSEATCGQVFSFAEVLNFVPKDDDLTEAAPAARRRITMSRINELHENDNVHWTGARYNFDGVVLNVHPDAEDDETAVLVQRNDTGKKVRLTADDLNEHTLTKL